MLLAFRLLPLSRLYFLGRREPLPAYREAYSPSQRYLAYISPERARSAAYARSRS